jgi:hypothetical protein
MGCGANRITHMVQTIEHRFACWPFFLKDPHLKNLRELPEFEALVSSLQAKYPYHLGLL